MDGLRSFKKFPAVSIQQASPFVDVYLEIHLWDFSRHDEMICNNLCIIIGLFTAAESVAHTAAAIRSGVSPVNPHGSDVKEGEDVQWV